MTISKETLAAIGEVVYSSHYNYTLTTYYRFNGKMYEVIEDQITQKVTVEELNQ
jgi:hypothetical protein